MPKKSKQNLTKRLLDSLIPVPGKDYAVWDKDIAGFGVRVKPSGKKSFHIKYRTENGRQRKTTLGSYGQLTLEQAKKLARIELGQVAAGEDPGEIRIQKRQAQTISELCDQYYDDAISGKVLFRGKPKKASTLATDKGRIERHIKPLLGTRRFDLLKRADIEKFMYAVRDGKTAIVERTKKRGLARVQGGMGTAKKAVSLLSAIFNYAIKEGMLEHNPCQYVEKPRDNKRTRFLNESEYAQFGQALSKVRETTSYDTAGLAILALALTGCRRNEILTLERKDVDFAGRCLRLTSTKTGSQIRPCGKPAMDILEQQLKSSDNEYVFPSNRGDGPVINIRTPMKFICDDAGFDDVTPHTLRHSFATVAHELGYSELTIAGLLGHSAHSVTSRYAHHVDHVLSDAADKVSDVILKRIYS
ncbi:MAG: tyrosine-type recombinase/integrase [Hyphomonadaceae bacterium]|nr:tyrosine-type recombinase/integrase [Hyphomonadaceae bacterium]